MRSTRRSRKVAARRTAAFISRSSMSPAEAQAALGPVMEIFERNNIDLTKAPVEIFPIAHYQMGGIEVDTEMATRVPGPLCGGRGGRRRQRRQSPVRQRVARSAGIRRAGRRTGGALRRHETRALRWDDAAARPHLDLIRRVFGRNIGGGLAPGRLMRELKTLMWDKVGAFRNGRDLSGRAERIRAMRLRDLDDLAIAAARRLQHQPCGMVRAAQRALGRGSGRPRRSERQREPGRAPARRFPRCRRRLSRKPAIDARGWRAGVGVRQGAAVTRNAPTISRSRGCASVAAPTATTAGMTSSTWHSRRAIPCSTG